MVDVAASFQVQVGTASMVASVGSISGITFGLLMAIVSIRYNHKKLLLAGIACNIPSRFRLLFGTYISMAASS